MIVAFQNILFIDVLTFKKEHYNIYQIKPNILFTEYKKLILSKVNITFTTVNT